MHTKGRLAIRIQSMNSEGGGQGLERELQKASLNRDEPVQLSSAVCRVDTQRQNKRKKNGSGLACRFGRLRRSSYRRTVALANAYVASFFFCSVICCAYDDRPDVAYQRVHMLDESTHGAVV